MKLVYFFALLGLDILAWETLKFYFRKFTGKNYLEVQDEDWVSLSNREYGALIDVGSNFGQFAGSFTDKNGELEIIAFDPHSECGEFMKSRLRGIKFYNFALGSSEGEFFLYYPKIFNLRFLSLSSLQKDNVSIWLDAHMPRLVRALVRILSKKVLVKRLDDLQLDLNDLNGRKTLMKIDVQGAELQVLLGATHFIQKYHPDIFIEMEFSTQDAVASFLIDAGYTKLIEATGDELWEHLDRA